MQSISLLLLTMLSARCLGMNGKDNFCGPKLADTLAAWCIKYEKRAMDFETDSVDYNEVIWPWLSRRYARAMALPSRRGKRGVVDECCNKPCSMNELLSYCDAFE